MGYDIIAPFHEELALAPLIADFTACSDELLTQTTVERKLERLCFQINARERARAGDAFDPQLYFALVRRVHDQIRPPIDFERVRGILIAEATLDPYPPGPYARRAIHLYRRVREALP